MSEEVQRRYGELLEKAKPVIELVIQFPACIHEHSPIAEYVSSPNWNGDCVWKIKKEIDRAIIEEGFVLSPEQHETYKELDKAYGVYKWAEKNHPSAMGRQDYDNFIKKIGKKYGIRV